MARVKCPLYSVQASGTIGNLLTVKANNIAVVYKMWTKRWKRKFNEKQLKAIKRFTMRARLINQAYRKMRSK